MITYKIIFFILLLPISILIFFLYSILHIIVTIVADIIFDTSELFYPYQEQFSKYLDFYFGLIDLNK